MIFTIVSIIGLICAIIELPGQIAQNKKYRAQDKQLKERLKNNPPPPRPKISSTEMSGHHKFDRLTRIVVIILFCVIIISLVIISLPGRRPYKSPLKYSKKEQWIFSPTPYPEWPLERSSAHFQSTDSGTGQKL